MRKSISILFLLITAIYNIKSQIPINIASTEEETFLSQYITEKYQHTAIRPFFKSIPDTVFFTPITETQLWIGKKDIFGLAGIGTEFFYKRKKISLWSNLLIGISHNPSWWQYQTFPQIGKQYFLSSDINVWTDLRFIVSYKTKYITFLAGRTKFHLGDSYHSIWLSEYSPALPFVGARVNIGPILYGYQIHWLQNPDLRQPQKSFFHAFNITHYLDFSIGPINLTMFETVVQDPIDSLGAHRGFDINYINPVIFFRAVDLSLGSPDNVLLGLGGSLKLFPKTKIYGYGLLDEMIVSQLLAGTKCWCLKYGLNAGGKSLDAFGIPGLSIQTEASAVRPYTYSHDNPILAYGNLYQPLAHPLGGNFYEALAKISYLKKDNYFVSFYASLSLYGQDIDTLNYGKNIFQPYTSRIGDYGIIIGQGEKNIVFYSAVSAMKKISNSLWIKAQIIINKSILPQAQPKSYFSFGITSQIENIRWDWR